MTRNGASGKRLVVHARTAWSLDGTRLPGKTHR